MSCVNVHRKVLVNGTFFTFFIYIVFCLFFLVLCLFFFFSVSQLYKKKNILK